MKDPIKVCKCTQCKASKQRKRSSVKKIFQESDFEHINKNRIKFPGELPD